MSHQYPRTERDLRELAVGFSAGRVTAEHLPLLLEHIAASMRVVLEAEKAVDGRPNTYAAAMAEATIATNRLHAAGIR